MREGYLRCEVCVTVCVMDITSSSVRTGVEELVGVEELAVDDNVGVVKVELVVVPATIESINATPPISPIPTCPSEELTSQLHAIKRLPLRLPLRLRRLRLFLLVLQLAIQRLHLSNIRRQHLPLDKLKHPSSPDVYRCLISRRRRLAFPCRP